MSGDSRAHRQTTKSDRLPHVPCTWQGALWLLIVLLVGRSASAQTGEPVQQLNAYLNQIGYAQLERRAQAMAAIRTRADAEARKKEVRKRILDLIGGLPESSGRVPFRQFGSVAGDGFRVEKIAFESLPSFFVTADVFVPAAGAGPFPAIVETPGHAPNGKLSEYNWGANLARAGIVTLVMDPLGQGERLQHYDAELEVSKVERMGEHEHASQSTLLIGEHVSRYFIHDAMRAVDYLTERKDVDARHIGAFGCSGGGTVTAYLAALDPRITVAATACYLTSFRELFPTTGPQDAEQTIPDFVADGLDFADWVELAAPRPYAIVSTTEDMFPFAGARQTFEEARRIYSLYGATDQLQWITGPGGHGNLGPIAKPILTFLVEHLTGHAAAPEFGQFRAEDPDELLVTPTGQVSTSMGGETVESLNRKEVGRRMVPARERLRAEIRATARVSAQAGPAPAVTVSGSVARDGYRVDTFLLESEPGIELSGLLAVPDRAGRKPVVLMMDDQPKERVAAGPDFTRLAKEGKLVMVLQPRGTPLEAQGAQAAALALGPYMPVSLRAIVVGKTIVGMRVDDTIRAINWLIARPDVDASSIAVYGRGALGMVALHAAALDSRITQVVAENTLVSYRMALEAPLHRNLAELTVPGVLLHYDVGELIEAISPRGVTIVNPVDALGQPVREEAVRRELAAAFAANGRGIRLARRGFRDPLPIE